MTAAAKERDTPKFNNPTDRVFDVAAGKKCYAGAIAVLNAAGDVEPGTAALAKRAVGVFAETVDNTAGGAGDVQVRVERGVFRMTNAGGITAAHVEQLAYIVDDQTVAETDNTNARSPAGYIYAVDDAGVWVGIGMGSAPLRLARGEHQQAAASDTIVTGLSKVIAVVVSPRTRTVKQLFFDGSPGDQAGTPAAGSFLLLSKKPTAVNDVTPVAATDFTDNIIVDWIAVGL